jgi:hypothetical protein
MSENKTSVATTQVNAEIKKFQSMNQWYSYQPLQKFAAEHNIKDYDLRIHCKPQVDYLEGNKNSPQFVFPISSIGINKNGYVPPVYKNQIVIDVDKLGRNNIDINKEFILIVKNTTYPYNGNRYHYLKLVQK